MRRKGDLSSSSNGENKRRGSKGGGGGGKVQLSPSSQRLAKEDERGSLVLWKRPIKTFEYFLRELSIDAYSLFKRMLQYQKTLYTFTVLAFAFIILLNIEGPHRALLQRAEKMSIWCLYWLGLGVLSSIGLGTGLHTFLLYLGPHIAAVTIAAHECGGLNFPQPPYPDDIVCPDEIDPNWTTSIWNIMRKVHLEAIMWGAGTALGELPPYFMARAARLSRGRDPHPHNGGEEDDEELKGFEELQRKKELDPSSLNTLDKAKLMVERLVGRVGFFGILVCASIPNPLFDLAGITCGHFLVPFWTFFGATLIGKAVIKMMLQGIFVIIAFSDVLIGKVMLIAGSIPSIGIGIQGFLQRLLQMQRERLHRDSRLKSESLGGNPMATVFEVVIIAMVGYFVLSIINSLAQSHHKRLHRKSSGLQKHWND